MAENPTTQTLMSGRIGQLLASLRDPSTPMGTARWAGIVMLCYDIVKHGANLYNVSGILALGGLVEAMKFFGRHEETPQC